MTPNPLAVVVVNYGMAADMLANPPIDITLCPTGRTFRVIVVDNFSTDLERQRCGEVCEAFGWDFVALEKNEGFGAGCNAGARKAEEMGAFDLLFLNPDAHITHLNLNTLRSAVNGDNCIYSPVVRRPDGSVWFQGGVLDWKKGRAFHSKDLCENPGWITGACMLVPRHVWGRLGGFDEKFFLYWEDVDLSVRCTQSGGALRVLPAVEAIHRVGGTHQFSSAKSPTYVQYNLVSRARFLMKNRASRNGPRWALQSVWFAMWLVRASARGLLSRSLPLYVQAFSRGIAGSLAVAARRREPLDDHETRVTDLDGVARGPVR